MRNCYKIAFATYAKAEASLKEQLKVGALKKWDIFHVYQCDAPGCNGYHIGHDERYGVISDGNGYTVTDKVSGFSYKPVTDREIALGQARLLNRADREVRRNARRGTR